MEISNLNYDYDNDAEFWQPAPGSFFDDEEEDEVDTRSEARLIREEMLGEIFNPITD